LYSLFLIVGFDRGTCPFISLELTTLLIRPLSLPRARLTEHCVEQDERHLFQPALGRYDADLVRTELSTLIFVIVSLTAIIRSVMLMGFGYYVVL
jgi:hypothetical protein